MTNQKPNVTFIAATPQESGLVKECGYDSKCEAMDGDLLKVILDMRDNHGYAVLLLNEEGSSDLRRACNYSGVPSHIAIYSRVKRVFEHTDELKEFLDSEYENAVRAYEEARANAVEAMLMHYGVYDTKNLVFDVATGAISKNPIPCGIENVDKALDGGLPRGGLVTLGALSSMGKTTLCNQIGDHVAKSKIPVLFCTCEQSRFELIAMSISRIVGVTEYDDEGHPLYATRSVIQQGKWTDKTQKRIHGAAASYNEEVAPYMHIMEREDQPSATDIRKAAEAVRMVHGGESPFVIVDYLQLLRSEKERRDERLAINDSISILRRLARDLDTTVLLISALNRASMSKGVTMSAFRESSGIEYSSDLMLGLQPRGMAQEISELTNDTKISQTATKYIDNYRDEDKKRGEIRILKNRTGRVPSAGIPVTFDPRCSTFLPDYDPWTPPSGSSQDDKFAGATKSRGRSKKS